MDRKELEKIVNSDDPLNKLKQNVGNKSLREWLESGYGDALSKGLAEEEISDGIKYLSIVDAIIPPCPKFMDNKVHEIIFKGSPTPNEDLELLEDLISALETVFFTMINNKNFPEVIGTQVLLKVVYYAGITTISNDFVIQILYLFILTNVDQYCNDFAHTAMALITILIEKLPEIWLQKLLQSKIYVKMKIILTKNGHNNCLYMNYLQKQFYGLDLGEEFYKQFPELKDIVFNEKCLTTALKSSKQIINENENLYQHFLISGLMHKFHTLLCSPSEIGDTTFVIKSFLTVFLCFETDTKDSYIWKNDLFKKLVELIVITLNSLLKYLDCVRNETDALVAVELLQSLYVLNSTWHQWFDIAVENKIIEDCMFKSRELQSCCDEFQSDFSLNHFVVSLVNTCPVLVEVHIKRKLFLSEQQHHNYFEVSRTNVLNDITKQFAQDDELVFYYWDISFKDEIGGGPGVTREVFSILSEELQKHYIEFCRDDTVKISDNEVIHAQSPDSALTKLNEEIERFELLGKIMAKAILDGQLLDITFRNGFFRQLRTTQCKKYSHLRRDYFDLIETIPVLENLFKQLLPVKRKIEAIRSDVDLSEHQKKEIISNLTFEDGNTFDDLCLNFTVPGTDIELIEGGRDVLLSPHNIDLYFEKLCAQNVQHCSARQFEYIRAGFDKVLFPGSTDCLLPDELEILICGEEIKSWTEEDLRSYCSFEESPSVQFLFQCLASFDSKRQKLFLKFVTGRNSLPSGGLSGLEPPLTISRINHENANSYLPTAATCSNLLYLPDYSSLSTTRANLLFAIEEGNNSFAFV